MERDGFVLFVGGTFSNWAHSEFEVALFPGSVPVFFTSAEQYMMVMKALTFGDFDSANRIMQTNDPRKQKELGRQIVPFDPVKWRSVCEELFYPGLFAKYEQNPMMNQELADTGNKILVEAAPWDRIWGIGMGADHPNATNPAKWEGENLLGRMLMRVRDDLRNAEEKEFAWNR